MRRAIQSEIEDPLSEKMLDGAITEGDNVTCDYKDGAFVFEKHQKCKTSLDETTSGEVIFL